MNIETKKDVLALLDMPREEYLRDIAPLAKKIYKDYRNEIIANAMLGYSNVCRSRCLYCGMRAGSKIERYRLKPDEIKNSIDLADSQGMKRIFFISGEDPGYSFDDILEYLAYAKKLGMRVCLGIGELEKSQFSELKAAGLDEFAMKFEMSDREAFNRLNPSTNFDRRMERISFILEAGISLASGNIVDYPGQTRDSLANDIMLMKELSISWAPIISYLPAKDTPLAKEGGPGNLELLHKEISILRIMMPTVNITAQQPGRDLKKGLSDTEGNLDAVNSGANMLFVDLLPDTMAKNFSVVDNRSSLRLSHIKEIAALADMEVSYI